MIAKCPIHTVLQAMLLIPGKTLSLRSARSLLDGGDSCRKSMMAISISSGSSMDVHSKQLECRRRLPILSEEITFDLFPSAQSFSSLERKLTK